MRFFGVLRNSNVAWTGLVAILLFFTSAPVFSASMIGNPSETIQQSGSVRVLVRLEVELSEFESGALEQSPQRIQKIQSVQESLVEDLPGNVTETMRARYVPVMGFEVNQAGLEALRNSPLVRTIHEDFVAEPLLINSIPRVEATTLHDSGIVGKDRTVVVLDTGTDTDHTALASSYNSSDQACFARGSDGNGDCPNGSTSQIGTGFGGAGQPMPSSPPGWEHGTHVTGIAVGDTDPTSGHDTGVAPGADVISVNVFSEVDGSAGSFASDQLKALEYVRDLVVNDGMDTIVAVNMSIGGGSYGEPCDWSVLTDIVKELRTLGVATVIASGNDGNSGSITHPGCVPAAVTVGSVSSEGTESISNFTNTDPEMVELMAPGEDITAAKPDDNTANKSGTSMSAPHVAGGWALLSAGTGEGFAGILESMMVTGESVSRGGHSYPSLRLAQAYEFIQSGGLATPSLQVEVGPNPYRPNDGDPRTGTPQEGILFRTDAEDVRLTIYTIGGELIRQIRDPLAIPGPEWNGKDRFGQPAGSGYYLYELEDLESGKTATGKLAIIR